MSCVTSRQGFGTPLGHTAPGTLHSFLPFPCLPIRLSPTLSCSPGRFVTPLSLPFYLFPFSSRPCVPQSLPSAFALDLFLLDLTVCVNEGGTGWKVRGGYGLWSVFHSDDVSFCPSSGCCDLSRQFCINVYHHTREGFGG